MSAVLLHPHQKIRAGQMVETVHPAATSSAAKTEAGRALEKQPHSSSDTLAHAETLHDLAHSDQLSDDAVAYANLLLAAPARLSVGAKAGEYLSFGPYQSSAKGLFFMPPIVRADEPEPIPIKLCDPIRIIAQTRDENRSNWGLLAAWTDDDGFEHAQEIRLEVLQSSGEEVRQLLLAGGLRADPERFNRLHLVRYLAGVKSENRLTFVSQAGWHGSSFVTPGKVFASYGHDLIFRSRSEDAASQQRRGTLQQWQDSIGRYAVGNGLLMLAMGTAFAAPLLSRLDLHGGGIHFRGPSSCGKSTLLRVAASVWSSPTSFVRSWRATANGLEGVAASRNDALLPLDELSECDPKSALATVYMLANGVGKARANRSGEARASTKWRLLFLSTGEMSLSDLAASDRFARQQEAMAGQEVRFLDVSADTGRHGVFHTLHDMPNGKALSEHLEHTSTQHFGTPIDAFLDRLVTFSGEDFVAISHRVEERRRQLLGETSEGQISRAARRFALASVGAELAAEFGVGPWTIEQAFVGVEVAFRAWLSDRGGHMAMEEMQAVRRIRDYLSENAALFQSAKSKFPIDKRSGFIVYENDCTTHYAFTPQAFKKALAGLSVFGAARTLHALGYLEGPDGLGKYAHSKFLGGQQIRVYLVKPSILNAE